MKADNQVIAEFMGHDTENTFLYNVYWESLMPVVEKISQIRCAPLSESDHDTFYPRTFGMLSPESRKPMVRINRNHLFEADTLIEATYQAVVEFIHWYNSQKK